MGLLGAEVLRKMVKKMVWGGHDLKLHG